MRLVKKGFRLRYLLISGVLLLTVLPAQGVPLSARDVALREASSFLRLLDQQRFAAAWSVGDAYFKSRLSVKKWQQILRAYRIPLGRVTARRRLAVRHHSRFEAAPPGIYVEVRFRSTFGRFERIERLVVHKDDDGRWRVTSYQLR